MNKAKRGSADGKQKRRGKGENQKRDEKKKNVSYMRVKKKANHSAQSTSKSIHTSLRVVILISY